MKHCSKSTMPISNSNWSKQPTPVRQLTRWVRYLTASSTILKAWSTIAIYKSSIPFCTIVVNRQSATTALLNWPANTTVAGIYCSTTSSTNANASRFWIKGSTPNEPYCCSSQPLRVWPPNGWTIRRHLICCNTRRRSSKPALIIWKTARIYVMPHDKHGPNDAKMPHALSKKRKYALPCAHIHKKT